MTLNISMINSIGSRKYCAFFIIFLILNIICCETVAENFKSNVLEKYINGKINQVQTRSLRNIQPPKIEESCTINNNGCDLICTDVESDIKLNTYIEKQSKNCESIELLLYEVNFKENKFKKTDLEGKFRLHTLILELCDIESIEDNAFDKPTMHDLELLKLKPTALDKINEKTFAGLRNLKKLVILNNARYDIQFKAVGFLQPMALTLTELRIRHSSHHLLRDFDTAEWFQGAVFGALKKVLFSENFFTERLNKKSFSNLKSVESLDLSKCHISFLADDTFDAIINTLKQLDLSFNELKQLSRHFLNQAAIKNIELDLTQNNWDCSCKNLPFLDAMTNEKLNVTTAPACKTPAHFHNLEIFVILDCCSAGNLKCLANATTTTTTTVSSNPDYPKVHLSCRRENIWAEHYRVWGKSIYFYIETLSAKTVVVTFEYRPAGAELVYFVYKNYTAQKSKSIYDKQKLITNLTAEHSYVFCFIPDVDEVLISPFNCRAHYLDVIQLKLKQAWLTRRFRPIFIMTAVISSLGICFIAGVLMYYLLRWRPTILLPHKRLESLGFHSKQVFLKAHCAKMTAADIYEALKGTPTKLEVNAYLKYFNSLQLPTRKIEATNLYDFLPPQQPAPRLPPLSVLAETVDNIYLDSIVADSNEPIYESLDEFDENYKTKIFVPKKF